MSNPVPFEKFSEKTKKVLTLAQEEAAREKSPYIGTEHILLAILRYPQGGAFRALTSLGVDYDKAHAVLASQLNAMVTSQVLPTAAVKRVISLAVEEMERLGHPNVGTGHLLIGLILYSEGRAAQALATLNVTIDNARAACSQEDKALVSTAGDGSSPRGGPLNASLSLYTGDLNALAKAGKLDPVIGRDDEINRICRILIRRTKNNPVLLGDPGVGKTVLGEGLAQKIVNGTAPESLKNRRILMLDMTALVAGCRYRGDFEERIKHVIDEATADPTIVLFIDELHTLVGAGSAEGSLDAANILKPALSRGDIQVIGATTQREYRHIERDAALERRFQPIFIKAPIVAEAEKILLGVKHLYEAHHRVAITDSALHAAAVLSDRYITERALPDKAIDLIDETCAKVRLMVDGLGGEIETLKASLVTLAAEKERLEAMEVVPALTLEKLFKDQEVATSTLLKRETLALALQLDPLPAVTDDDVAEVVFQRTGVPVARLTVAEQLRYSQMESILSQAVVGQADAIETVSKAVRKSRAGLAEPGLPIASFIFVGGTGIGKTELARALAKFLFDDPDALIRFDMSEFQERHLVARLIGSPPGYVGSDEGGQLTEAVRLKPFSVVLFDEIEKAHPDIYNILLQISGAGRLSDAKGKVTNFANTVIILTSNLGTTIESSGHELGFVTETNSTALEVQARVNRRKRIDKALKDTFRAEFLNRQSAIVTFEALRKAEILKIADMKLTSIINRASEQKVRLIVSDAARSQLSLECAGEGLDETEQQLGTVTKKADGFQFGARPMQRLVETRISDPLAEQIVKGAVKPGDTVVVDYGPLGYAMDIQQPSVSPVPASV